MFSSNVIVVVHSQPTIDDDIKIAETQESKPEDLQENISTKQVQSRIIPVHNFR